MSLREAISNSHHTFLIVATAAFPDAGVSRPKGLHGANCCPNATYDGVVIAL